MEASPLEHEPTSRPHPLQEALGLTDEEFEVLTAVPAEAVDGRDAMLSKLSLVIVGHFSREEAGEFLRTPQKSGIAADERFLQRRIPLEVAREPGGLEKVVADARRETSRRIAAKHVRGEASAPVPEAKRS